MFQTSYLGNQPLQVVRTYVGGICRLWYIDIDDVAGFPRVNAGNQALVSEPTLKVGKAWFGPISVQRDKLGMTEDVKRTSAGPYYELKLEATHVGESRQSRVNFENHVYGRYLVVAKMRAGGLYLLLGTLDSFLTLNLSYTSGNNVAETALTKLVFSSEMIGRALVMPSFTADAEAPVVIEPPTGSEPMANHKEIIPFNASTINIPWTSERFAKFGSHPVIEVYTQEDGSPPTRFTGGSIESDHPPPAFTELTVKIGAVVSGYIVIT